MSQISKFVSTKTLGREQVRDFEWSQRKLLREDWPLVSPREQHGMILHD